MSNYTGDSFDSLANKYNRLCARFRDMEQQSSEKQLKWQEIEQELRNNESLMRDFCKMVLAKDPSEMVLGEGYSWDSLSTRELVERARQAFVVYNEKRTHLMRQIQEQSEDRRNAIENLEIQLEQKSHQIEEIRAMHTDQPQDTPSTADEPKEAEISEKAKNRTPYAMQQAAEAGKITLGVYEDDDTFFAHQTPAVQTIQIFEEDEDISATRTAQDAEVERIAANVKTQQLQTATVPAPKKVAAAQEKDRKKQQSVLVNADELADKLSPRQWLIIQVIGSTGVSEASEIVKAVIETAKDDSAGEYTLRHDLQSLNNLHCINAHENISHPAKPRFKAYSLTDVGVALYERQFGTMPVLSELEVLRAQHDNLSHGFGIKHLKQILENSGCYTNISDDRKANTRKLNDGTQYIPDITAKAKSRGFTAFFEYERDTHHQSDFNIKLNKANKVTKFLDIVAPDAKAMEGLKNKVSSWLASRGGGKNIGMNCIRIASIRQLETAVKNNQPITSNEVWGYVFDLKVSDEPVCKSNT